jgi:hypothetical protein
MNEALQECCERMTKNRASLTETLRGEMGLDSEAKLGYLDTRYGIERSAVPNPSLQKGSSEVGRAFFCAFSVR